MTHENEHGVRPGTPNEAAPAQAGESKTPLWKRPITWIGSVVAALVLSAAGAFGSGLGHDLLSGTVDHHSTNNHVVVNSATYVQAANDGFSFAFPQALSSVQAGEVSQQPVDWQNYSNQSARLRGAVTDDAAVQVVLRNNSNSAAVVTGVAVVRTCRPPLTGTLLFSPSAGEDTDIYLGFNLDDAVPLAQNYENGTLNGNFFADHTISIPSHATQSIVIHGKTQTHFCSFTLQFMIDTSAGQTTVNVTNNGKPFVVTAITNLSAYKALYVGGVLGGNGGAGFVRVSVQKLSQLTGFKV
jgi:hypothetical protein